MIIGLTRVCTLNDKSAKERTKYDKVVSLDSDSDLMVDDDDR